MKLRTGRLLFAALAAWALMSCGGGDEQSTARGGRTSSDGSPATSGGDAVDLSQFDVCSLMTVTEVQTLTGSQARFVSQGGKGKCFWGAAVPGVGAYVEITVNRAGGLGAGPVGGCPGSPVTGVGDEAIGGNCPGTQEKVFVQAFERGVVASVLVNDPERPLTPADLVATANAIFDKV